LQGVEGATNRPDGKGATMTRKSGKIAFQGEPGAYSHEACRMARPGYQDIPCRTFEEVIDAVREGRADLAMLPVENSTYGRVADIHRLLPESGLRIVDEAFVRVRIALMGLPGTRLDDIRHVRAHLVLIPQAKGFLTRHGITADAAADSAGAAAELAQHQTPHEGVLASELAAQIYGLDVLAKDIEDNHHNTTRFLIMAPEADLSPRGDHGMITSFVFQVRNIPAALYKAMGGFATNGVNMTKLESYMVGGTFTATQFYADIEGHPDDAHVRLALEELDYFTSYMEILGVYPADVNRHRFAEDAAQA
jgi:prephenate dehydratase